MTGRDDIEPGRLDELIAGAPPRTDEERAMTGLLAQVRAAEPAAPPALRDAVERVVADGTAPSRRGRASRAAGRLPAALAGLRARLVAHRRRALAVGVPALALALALTVVLPVAFRDRDDASGGRPSLDGAAAPTERADAGGDPTGAPAEGRFEAEGADVPGGAPVPAPGRAQRIETWTRVHVADVEALSRASTEAMEAVRDLGGFTARSDYRVPGAGDGRNELVFRVPVERAPEAIEAFGRLGTVTGQEADIVDITADLSSAGRAIDRLRDRVADLRRRSAAAPDDADLRAALARAERELAGRIAARRAAAADARSATLRLTLTTEAPAAAPADRGRIVAALADSWDRLAGALAWTLGALVLVGPFAAVLAAGAWTARRMRRRSDARLLGT